MDSSLASALFNLCLILVPPIAVHFVGKWLYPFKTLFYCVLFRIAVACLFFVVYFVFQIVSSHEHYEAARLDHHSALCAPSASLDAFRSLTPAGNQSACISCGASFHFEGVYTCKDCRAVYDTSLSQWSELFRSEQRVHVAHDVCSHRYGQGALATLCMNAVFWVHDSFFASQVVMRHVVSIALVLLMIALFHQGVRALLVHDGVRHEWIEAERVKQDEARKTTEERLGEEFQQFEEAKKKLEEEKLRTRTLASSIMETFGVTDRLMQAQTADERLRQRLVSNNNSLLAAGNIRI
jgi:hypothetical protein